MAYPDPADGQRREQDRDEQAQGLDAEDQGRVGVGADRHGEHGLEPAGRGGQVGVAQIPGPMTFDPFGEKLPQMSAAQVFARISVRRLDRAECARVEQILVTVVDRLDAGRLGLTGQGEPLGALDGSAPSGRLVPPAS